MKSKKSLIVTLLIVTLFITACGEQEDTTSESVFLGGTQGVVANFEPFGVEEDGTYTIFDTEAFPIEVTLLNKGEYDLKEGDAKVRLLGPLPAQFSGIASWELLNTGLVDKISELVTSGGEETVTFGTDAKYLGDITGFLDINWLANVEYNYETQVIIPEVCLKEDLTDERVCEVKETKTYFVSGAPLVATAVEESTAGKGIMALKIAIENKGTGDVAKQDGEFGVTNRLNLEIDDPTWECKSGGKAGEARLLDGKAEVVCKLKEALAEDTLATKQIKVTLKYKYRDLMQEKLRIKESAE